MLFRLHFLLYCIFVSYNQFLFSFLHFILCRMCVCHMFNKVLTYLLTYLGHIDPYKLSTSPKAITFTDPLKGLSWRDA